MDNLLDDHSATYGSYFETGSGLVTPALTDPRTVTLRRPVSVQLGLKLQF